MKIYEVSFRELVGFLTLFAETEGDASDTFKAWFVPRFEKQPGPFTVREATSERIASDIFLRLALAYNNAGVATFVIGHGWFVLPATMEEAGLVFLDQRPVKAFKVTDPETVENDDQVFIFAIDEAEGKAIYAIWSELHNGQVSSNFSLKERAMASFRGEYKQLAIDASHGATGVAGPCQRTVRIVPPWHNAAGDL